MKCRELDKIILPKFWRSKPVYKKHKKIIGFDTETSDGKPYLLCNSYGSVYWRNGTDAYLKILSKREYSKFINVFYNLEYDIYGILRELPIDKLKELMIFHELKYGDYILKMIPKKLFIIKRNNYYCHYYDLLQFYHKSLDVAAQYYLHEKKLAHDYDLLNNVYWVSHHKKEVEKYCIHDAWLTEQLGYHLQQQFSRIGLDFNKPVSPATLSQRYFLQNANLPKFSLPQMQQYALNAYHGGRFEVFKRGYIEEAYSYDINSAYPDVMRRLLDYTKGDWYYLRFDRPEHEMGIVKVKFTDEHKYVGFQAIENNGFIYYPNVIDRIDYMTLEEYRYLRDFTDINVKLIDGWFFIPSEYIYPFLEMEKIFSDRLMLKEKEDPLQLCYKIIMNSQYGKQIQLVKKWVDMPENYQGYDGLDIISGDRQGSYIPRFKAGQLFNPLYAAYITGLTRLEIYKKLKYFDNSILATFTDSIISTDKKIWNSKKLGEWGLDMHGELLLIGCGIYTIRDGNKEKTKIRGLNTSAHINLFKIVEEHMSSKTLQFNHQKVVKLGDYLRQKNHNPELMLNQWLNKIKEININADNKRRWNRRFHSCMDLRYNIIDSQTLLL